MLNQTPLKVFLRYIIPSVLGLLAISSANIVDGYFVGNHVGAIGLASINVAFPVMSILFGIGLMFAVGSSVIISTFLGEGKKDEAKNIFSKALISIFFISIITCSLIHLNIGNILALLKIEGELNTNATEYLNIIVLFLPFVMIGIVLDYCVRADGNPNLSFFALISTSLVNIVLDYIFIAKLGHGLTGAALATGISFSILILVLLPHFFTNRNNLKFIRPVGSFRIILMAAKNGLSEFINESSVGIMVMLFNFMMIKYLGGQGVAAYTIVSYFIMISIMVSFAVSDGLQPIIAQHYGARSLKRIKVFLKLGFVTIMSFSTILVILILLKSEVLVNIFLSEDGLGTKEITVEFLKYTWPGFFLVGVNILITSYLTSVHRPKESAVISLSRSLILPLGFIIILSHFWGITGVYLALPFSELATFLIAFYFFKRSFKGLKVEAYNR